ncbi:uncharacterized protein K452DRAFT_321788 [Aplosporella prunicola CBS 121167]|uniref:Uncharacterized protein n=1 Tax=Aplosporella prunicola CBS 121167 TaxID=1176127 RepID=A0A6A6B2A6_9PEZI|nr:uncharacterized protein K452DRAFT_321788 [Aplosporella prunicola CBS 121167]KAF2137354.1 hypothetical protein K452DRAFT_321788 [Aplosporella prunicola CBS 121167]
MFFPLKSAFLLGLAAISVASPIANADAASASAGEVAYANNLFARAKVPEMVKCRDKEYSKADINNALSQARTAQSQGGVGGFPKFFGNEGKDRKPVFPNIPKSTNLYEYPLKKDSAWTGGAKDPVRVVMKEDYSYAGVMGHTPDVSNAYKKCA